MVNFYEFYSVRLKINTLEISVLEYNLIWKIAQTFCSTKSVIANGIGAIKYFLTVTKLIQKFLQKLKLLRAVC